MPRRGLSFLSGAQQVRFASKSIAASRRFDELAFQAGSAGSPRIAALGNQVGHRRSAGTAAAISPWRRGPVGAATLAPSPGATNTQVLSFGEPPGLAAANGLCAAGVSRPGYRVRRQLAPSPRDLGSDFRDQPRTVAPPGGALKGRYERSALRPPCINRCWIGWRAPRQYGRSLARRQPEWSSGCGGHQ